MSKSMNVLTGIDYWLDNSICNINKLLICHHSNGTVKNPEIVLTEDIPYLEDASFSPEDVKNYAKNIFSFLKSNATEMEHTYWLFKGA